MKIYYEFEKIQKSRFRRGFESETSNILLLAANIAVEVIIWTTNLTRSEIEELDNWFYSTEWKNNKD